MTVNSSGERGLLGVTFDPNFATNNFVYVYYTATTPAIHNRVSRFTANGDVAVARQRGAAREPREPEQRHQPQRRRDPLRPRRQALRRRGRERERRQRADAGEPPRARCCASTPTAPSPPTTRSSTPPPATTARSGRWACATRSRSRSSARTGRMFINDVGEVTWEEINDGIAGSNYGWPTTEGPTTDPRFRAPLFAYRHSGGTPHRLRDHRRRLLQPDDAPRSRARSSASTSSPTSAAASSGCSIPPPATDAAFATGVVVARRSQGALGRLAVLPGARRTAASAACARARPTSRPRSRRTRRARRVAVGQSATFSVAASGTAPLSFQWQRNGANIAGATSSSFTIASVATSDNGAMFRAVVTQRVRLGDQQRGDADGHGKHAAHGHHHRARPRTRLYAGGDVINFAGTANDPETGALPASAFTWRVDFHHDTHFHPSPRRTPPGSRSGSFTVPTRGEVSANVFFRIHPHRARSGRADQHHLPRRVCRGPRRSRCRRARRACR